MTEYVHPTHRAANAFVRGLLVMALATLLPIGALLDLPERRFYAAVGGAALGWSCILALAHLVHGKRHVTDAQRMVVHTAIFAWVIACAYGIAPHALPHDQLVRFRMLSVLALALPFVAGFDHARCYLRKRPRRHGGVRQLSP